MECSANRVSLVPHLHRAGVTNESGWDYSPASANTDSWLPEASREVQFKAWGRRFLIAFNSGASDTFLSGHLASGSKVWRDALKFMASENLFFLFDDCEVLRGLHVNAEAMS